MKKYLWWIIGAFVVLQLLKGRGILGTSAVSPSSPGDIMQAQTAAQANAGSLLGVGSSVDVNNPDMNTFQITDMGPIIFTPLVDPAF